VSIVVIYAVAAVLASAEAVVDSSSMVLVPSTVGADQLERATGVLSATELTTNGLIGPPLGGLLFGVAMIAPFGLDAASFGAAVVAMAFMRGDYAPRREPGTRRHLHGEIVDGFRWLWRHPLLRNLALVSTLLGTVAFIGNAVFVLFAQESLGLSDAGYGLLLVPGAQIGPPARSLAGARSPVLGGG